MQSKYGIFCEVIEKGSFTKAARQMGYTQSAVSQTIKSLERELGTVLIERRKDGIALSADGRAFFPYFQDIYNGEKALEQKRREMEGLENSTIRIGTFTSVSRNLLPQLMKRFKERYPGVDFFLKQGEYTSIARWVQDGSVDFGFVNVEAVEGVELEPLYEDAMVAVLPKGHLLAAQTQVTLGQMADEPFILLDEGDYSLPMKAFGAKNLSPQVAYKVYDDYSILAMIRQSLGVSILYDMVLRGFEDQVAVRPIEERPTRTIALAWRNWDTMSLAARRFTQFVCDELKQEAGEQGGRPASKAKAGSR